MAIGPKPYTVTWPFGPNTSTEIDQMFDQLFTNLRFSAIGEGGAASLTFPVETKGSLLYISDASGTVDGLPVSSSAGAFIRSTGTLPDWSAVTLPNSATTGDIIFASAANAYGNLAAAAAGKVIRATGVGAAPAYSTFTISNTWAVGSIASAASSNALTELIVGSVGKIIRSDGTVPVYTTWTIPSSFAQGDLIFGSASNVLTALAKDTNATRYLSNTGASNNPAYAQVNLANGVSGILPVANGGTGTTNASRSLFDYFADSTVGGAEADIYTDTLAANTFNSNGDKVIAEYGGNFVTDGTELTDLKVYLAGTAIWDSTGVAPTTGTTSWRVYVELIRVSSSIVRYTVSLNTTGASGYVYAVAGELTGLTLSGTNILKITGASSGVGSGSGDIIGKMGYVKFVPAA